MAANRKYAGLPDLDPAPEIYETPELTDDASTVQTSTLRTESPTPSEDGKQNDHFDRARLNQEEARRRFEPAVVNATDTNLSDAIGGNRKGYAITHRRRRRRIRREDGTEEIGDLSDVSGGEEENLTKKLARLKREAEEVRLELLRREKEAEEAEFKDSLEQQQQQQDGEQNEDAKELLDGVEQLNQILNNLKATSQPHRAASLEQEFVRQLAPGNTGTGEQQRNGGAGSENDNSMSTAKATSPLTASSITAITAFADRLTALESALGVSSISASTNTTSIIPTLDILTTQVTSLNHVINPSSTPTNAQRDHLDTLTNRLHALHAEADRMLNTRKAALQALNQLHEARYSGTSHNSAAFAKYISRREARHHRDSQTLDTDDASSSHQGDDLNASAISRSKSKDPNTTKRTAGAIRDGSAGEVDLAVIEDRIFTDVFLEEQSSKITALYNTLPTIQSMQPLLPLVLERLRGLSVVHASASSAQHDMDDIETRLAEWEKNLREWKVAVENVEKGIEESKTVMRDNVDVVSGMVRGLERRLDQVSGPTTARK